MDYIAEALHALGKHVFPNANISIDMPHRVRESIVVVIKPNDNNLPKQITLKSRLWHNGHNELSLIDIIFDDVVVASPGLLFLHTGEALEAFSRARELALK